MWKDTSDTPNEPRDAAVKKAFESLPKAWRDNVAQVEKLVKTGDAKVLLLVKSEPLAMKACDEKTEAQLVAKVSRGKRSRGKRSRGKGAEGAWGWVKTGLGAGGRRRAICSISRLACSLLTIPHAYAA